MCERIGLTSGLDKESEEMREIIKISFPFGHLLLVTAGMGFGKVIENFYEIPVSICGFFV